MSDGKSIPTLERWALLVPTGRRLLATPDHPAVVLTGVVSGDPRFPNGAAIVTSCVLALDPVRAVAHTRTTCYRLGKPSRVFLRWVREHGHAVADFARGVGRARAALVRDEVTATPLG
jgi:hypothetical protein